MFVCFLILSSMESKNNINNSKGIKKITAIIFIKNNIVSFMGFGILLNSISSSKKYSLVGVILINFHVKKTNI